jgi:beta-glucanase (GH16 family)
MEDTRFTAARTAVAVATAGALLVGLAACGSGSSSDSNGSSSTVAKKAGAADAAWDLTWSDEFNDAAGTKPDPAKWSYKLGGTGNGNSERQLYTDSAQNASTDGNGNLVITAIKETPPGSTCWYGPCQYTSARISTKNKFSQQYGRFEVRVQVPSGQGIWPAFWMLGDDPGNVGWPQQGEIDVMEIVGHAPSTVHGSLHGPGYSGGSPLTKSYTLPAGQSFADGFHTFAVEWEPGVVRFYADDQLYETRTPADVPAGSEWVYDHPFYLILNLAVGGNWPGDPNAATEFPSLMKVDYVRVFKRSEGAS